MKLLYSLLLLTAFQCSAQHTITIIDADTEQPIQGAVATNENNGWTADETGKIIIPVTGTSVKVNLSVLGYEPVTVTLSRDNTTVKLHRKYNTLSEVEIRAQKIKAGELIYRAAAKVPQNYPIANKPVKGAIYLTLIREDDTLMVVSRPSYYYNRKKKKWAEYELYQSGNDSLIWHKDYASYDEMYNYIIHSKVTPESSLAEHLFSAADGADKMEQVISTFTVGGKKYYDIVLIKNKAWKHTYTVGALLAGYGKNHPNKDKQYVSIYEYIISADNYAVAFSQTMAIESSDENFKELLALKSRDDIRSWLERAEHEKRGYQLWRGIYRFDEKLQDWVPERSFVFDNTAHPGFRGDSLGNYTYIQDIRSDGVIDKMPKQDMYMSIWTDILKGREPENKDTDR